MKRRFIPLVICGPLVAAASLMAPSGGASAACSVSHYRVQTDSSQRSDEVRCIQATLNDKGFNSGPVDGWYGPVTRAAVVSYQQAKGLTADGEVGSQTAGSLGIWTSNSGNSGGSSSAQPARSSSSGASSGTPGNCSSFDGLFRANGLPVGTFRAIAWRESGCNPRSFVSDSDDLGGGLLGINLKGSNGPMWNRWCGATVNNITNAAVNVRCAGVAYDKLGLRPWS